MQFGGSTTRDGLWRVRRESDALPLFPTERDDLVLDRESDAEATETLAEVLAAGGQHLRLVIVAMTSSSHQADRIEWGPAVLGAAGMLVWEPELLWNGTSRAAPVGINTTALNSGSAPRPAVSPRVRPEEEVGSASGSTSDA